MTSCIALLKSDFHFDLPEALIAQQPATPRSSARMLVLDGETSMTDTHVHQLPQWLNAGDLLIFNDTKVIPARLFGQKSTGGKVEVMVERLLPNNQARVQIRASKAPKPNTTIALHTTDGSPSPMLQVLGRDAAFFQVALMGEGLDDHALLRVLEAHGHMPLPPYIQRDDNIEDQQRYQTLFAEKPGAVAAPTAGLHFDEPLKQALTAHGVQTGTITLHVGAGTFMPMRVDAISDHTMHHERIEVSPSLCQQIHETKAQGGRIIAVGTTVLRALESAWQNDSVQPFHGETDIFIYPGKSIHSIDALLTNFHLPESTLLMLVSAFMGTERMLAAYRHAVEKQYRFFSYGDAMLLVP